jgi:hypothetical protein
MEDVNPYRRHALHQRRPVLPETRESAIAHAGGWSRAHQSGDCHDSRIDAARIASELSCEKFPIASPRPLSATPR